jgi:hypothetical protein
LEGFESRGSAPTDLPHARRPSNLKAGERGVKMQNAKLIIGEHQNP